MDNRELEWEETNENDMGVKTIAYKKNAWGGWNIAGFNGITDGEKVKYQDKEYTIVNVSRMGLFGLSETGALPYILRVKPTEVEIVKNLNLEGRTR